MKKQSVQIEDKVMDFIKEVYTKADITIEEKGNKIRVACSDENDFFNIYSEARKTGYKTSINARSNENRYSVLLIKELQ